MPRRKRSPEENERRAKIRELLLSSNISSMEDIQDLFKETIAEFCNHCKMTVEKALKAVSGVENVEVDLAAKCAKITLNADVADDVLMDAVAKKGFTPVKMG